MNRREFLKGPGGLLLAGVAAEGPRPGPRRGVALAGGEFGAEKPTFSNLTPGEFGRDYTYNSARTVAYFCRLGLRLLRVPFRWERVQPHPGEDLDARELQRLRTVVAWARAEGGKVLLDLHNYGRFALGRPGGGRRECVIDEVVGGQVLVSRDHFADLWYRLARAFRDEEAVAGYGLMNEPHHMGSSDWKLISQAAVDAIRAARDHHRLYVAGDDWSSAARWVQANGPRAWIRDPQGQVVYEAHCYFDHDGSGHYHRSYAREVTDDPRLEDRGVERLLTFAGWCAANGVPGLVGEFGIPSDEPGWRPVLARFLQALDRAGLEGCCWAAGEWWADYRLSIQPSADFSRPTPQLSLLLP
jgi:endoglucanase